MFDLAALKDAVDRHGRVARVVVAETAGSVPREVGAAMLVWDGGQSGTIGGGALEFDAARHAFSRRGLTRHPLGPSLGQCCGGAVTLLTEVFDAAALDALDGQTVIARGPGTRPLSVARLLDRARAQGVQPRPQLMDGWMIEPVAVPSRKVWLWGAGHVGRAIVSVLMPIPDIKVTWIDTDANRFPATVPDTVDQLVAANPVPLMRHAPADAAHLILTYSHAIDLDLCHAALSHQFAFCGLIGSATKWARFRKRLIALGHDPAALARITCPIGDPLLGKHPQSIAIGVAAQIIAEKNKERAAWPTHFSASQA